MADSVKIEIASDLCDFATVSVKMGDGYAYIYIDGQAFEASVWPELKAEVDRLLALANAAVNTSQPKDTTNGK